MDSVICLLIFIFFNNLFWVIWYDKHKDYYEKKIKALNKRIKWYEKKLKEYEFRRW